MRNRGEEVETTINAVLCNPARIAALRATGLLDSPPEKAFDRLTDLARRMLGVPVCLISLVEIDRQFFKSCVGLPEPWASLRQTHLSHSFCQHVVHTGAPLVVEDARQHPLLRDNLAIRDLNVIAYLGIPLATPDAQTVGSFCAIDTKPRTWIPDEIDLMRDLAESVTSEIALRHTTINALRESEAELRLRNAELQAAIKDAESARLLAEKTLAALRESRQRQEGLIQSAMDAIIAIDSGQRIVLFNPAAERMFSCSASEALGASIDRFIPARLRQAHREHVKTFGATGATSRQMGALGSVWGLRQNGEEFPVEASISQLDAGGQKLFTVILRDITERKRHEERAELLMREVNHRCKNMLAVVQSIALQTAATKPEDFIARFGDRIQALSASQDLLVQSTWTGVDIKALVQSQLAHFHDLIGRRIKLKGLSLFLSASAAQTLGMALHELATNAGKYGALSNGEGRLEVGWSLEHARGGEEAFTVSWREEGGPPVTAPAKLGFGSTVIRRMAQENLDAEVALNFAPSGLSWCLRCPAKEVIEGRSSLPAHK